MGFSISHTVFIVVVLRLLLARISHQNTPVGKDSNGSYTWGWDHFDSSPVTDSSCWALFLLYKNTAIQECVWILKSKWGRWFYLFRPAFRPAHTDTQTEGWAAAPSQPASSGCGGVSRVISGDCSGRKALLLLILSVVCVAGSVSLQTDPWEPQLDLLILHIKTT